MKSPRTIVHIGYPKAGSTFLQEYMATHPELDSSLEAMDALVERAGSLPLRPATDGRVRLITNEKIAESLISTDDGSVWARNKFLPGTWDETLRHNRIDPAETARRVRDNYGAERVLIVIREQAAWLHSAYKYYLSNLPAKHRSFADFCATSIGRVYLELGHYDRIIEPYIGVFGADHVLVLRAETLRNRPEQFATEFCQFAGIAYRPIPQGSANVGSSNEAAALRARFPVIDHLPAGVRRIGSAVLSRLSSSGGSMFSDAETAEIHTRYADSNRRVERLLQSVEKTAASR